MLRFPIRSGFILFAVFSLPFAGVSAEAEAAVRIRSYPVIDGAHPHDVAPNPAGGIVWYTAQSRGALGRLDPATGEVRHIPLGEGSRPHGVIVGPEGHAWVTDSGLNAIVSVDEAGKVTRYPLPEGSGYANLNTATFDKEGILWFTGQSGVYGRLDPATGELQVFDAPRGNGPYGIGTTPGGEVWYVSLAGSYLAQVDTATGAAAVIDPPTEASGPRRVWSDSQGKLWVAEWKSGQLSKFDPDSGEWRQWRLPGDAPAAYAVYVDDFDKVWVSDFGANAILRFDPEAERFESFSIPRAGAAVRQMLGRPGEVWTAESGTDRLTVYHYE